MANIIRVLIVDDSAVVRKVLSEIINREPDMEVVATAPDPYSARDKLVLLKPDVMTLDIEMPRMDGISFLRRVMHYFPVPTIIVSSVTSAGCAVSMKALELGAVNVIPKPNDAFSVHSIEEVLIDSIRSAAKVKLNNIISKERSETVKGLREDTQIVTTNKIIAIGASTGGTEAIKDVLCKLPIDTPAILIVQHMPAAFTAAFADRLNALSKITVKEAKDGDSVLPGIALLAPGDFHMVVKREGGRYIVRLKKGPFVWHQRPAVDVLFHSVAENAGLNSVGILLTGMGKDGASGMLAMRRNGAKTIAQSEESCVVFGMPKAAIDVQAVEYVEHLSNIPDRLLSLFK